MNSLYHGIYDSISAWIVAPNATAAQKKMLAYLEKCKIKADTAKVKLHQFKFSGEVPVITGYHRDGENLTFTFTVKNTDVELDEIRFGALMEYVDDGTTPTDEHIDTEI